MKIRIKNTTNPRSDIIGIKGQGHVEMILSFVLFISFLLFIFAFMNPFVKYEEPDYVMETIQRSIIENLSSEIGILRAFPNETNGCYNLSEDIIEDYGSNYMEKADSGLSYTLYFSDKLNSFPGHMLTACPEENYTLGVYTKGKFISEEKIKQLNASYVSNYHGLKDSLGINKEFVIRVEDKHRNPIFTAERRIPDNTEVEAREIPIRTINEYAQIEERILIIKTW